MEQLSQKPRIKVFCTAPQSKDGGRGDYVRRVAEVVRWSERYGYEGILIYADNGLVDPWITAGVVVQNSENLCPLVALQPISMHPYTAAKIVATYAFLHGRKLYLNLIAGGFRNDLLALGDETPHDDRYKRLTEYALIIKRLLESPNPLTFQGNYYQVTNLKMSPALPEELMPGILISGSSAAGLEAAREIGATAIKYPHRPDEELSFPRENDLETGIRVGIIARENSQDAWRVARRRFPEDRKGRLTHEMAMKVSDSRWHQQLSEMAAFDETADDPYWLGPFQNYKTFCPYLVGSYEQVAAELSRYVDCGHETFITDVPPCEEELEHTSIVFGEALAMSAVATEG